MSKFIRMSEDVFMNTICNTIMTTALSEKSQQVVYDGEDFHTEELTIREFQRGYVIHYDSRTFDMPCPDSPRFTEWLADLLYIHANACSAWLTANGFTIEFTTGDTVADRKPYDNRSFNM